MNGSQDAYMSTVAILVFVISLYIRDGQECKMARDKNVLLIQPIEKKTVGGEYGPGSEAPDGLQTIGAGSIGQCPGRFDLSCPM
jgi:hypothetical protein